MSWFSKWLKVEPVATMEDLVLIAKEVEEIKQDLVNTMVMVQKHKEEIRLLKGGITTRVDESHSNRTITPTSARPYRGYDSYEYTPPRRDDSIDTAIVIAGATIASSSYDDSSSSSSSYGSSSSSSSDSSSCGCGD